MHKKTSRSANKAEQQRQKSYEQPANNNLISREVIDFLTQVNIVLDYQDKPGPGEMLPNETVSINSDNEIDLRRLVETLKAKNFLTCECSLSYLSSDLTMKDYVKKETDGVYIYCGDTTKLNEATNIPCDAINSQNQVQCIQIQITLKIRKNKRSLVENLLQEQRKNSDKETLADDKGAKTKEKRIGEVVEKVALWRRFYTGFYDQRGNFIQKPLEQAANEVGIAKKTLDDYLLQIRCGKKYGFNFNANVDGKIGELRAFVRDSKKTDKKDHKS